ncbi:uncharacterized protein LOC141673723 [Apium graveolens]|uniref:uncharacterized protein LOC141673723 n=1 Tax=Apium graveolens TaxID=4045 RepID=UPI003D7A6368
MRDDLKLEDGFGLTIISDQQKGLKNAVNELLPSVEHKLCTRFNTGILKRCFWKIALPTHKVAYARAMRELEKHSKVAHAHLSKFDPKFMPLLTMLQEIHYKLMTRMTTRRDEMLNTNLQICPRIKKKLDLLVTESRKWSAAWDGAKKFQVKSGIRSITVDLENGTCDYRMYDLTGIPCHHAIAVIHSRRQEPLDYVSGYYKRDKYLATYKFSLEAIKGEEYWDFHSTETMLPPDIPKKLRGRPKKMRRREEWE